jgi:hypothetical protein
VSVDGINQDTRTIPDRLALVPHVAIADIDSSNTAVNPPGTRWFSACNVYVENDQDVTNNSRWVEFVPHRNGSSFTFSYIGPTTGTPNFRTIPGLVEAAGPSVIRSSPAGDANAPLSTATVTFDREIDPTTFTPASITSFTGPNGPLSVHSVDAVPGRGNRIFTITFDAAALPGSYTMVIGPDVRDTFGHPMDQNGNGIPGEPDDAYTLTFGVAAPTVVRASPAGAVSTPVDHVEVTFDRPMDPTTFDPSEFNLTGPNGPVTTTGFVDVAGSNDTVFDFTFDPQGVNGNYTYVLSSGAIQDAYGNYLPADYNGSFTVTGGPVVTGYSPTGNVSGPVDHVRVTFSRAIDATTFTPAQATLLDSGGNPITVTDVVDVPGGNDTQFDVTFDPQSTQGTYTLTLATAITDQFGNPLLDVTGGELVTNGGFETNNFNGWTLSGSTGGAFVGGNAHTGTHAANLGPVGSEVFLAQNLATTAGVTYTLDYWLANGGGPANQFEAYVNGAVVTGSQVVNSAAFGYREYRFTFVAAGTTTELKFGARQDPAYFYLDDVSVTPAGGSLMDQFTIV